MEEQQLVSSNTIELAECEVERAPSPAPPPDDWETTPQEEVVVAAQEAINKKNLRLFEISSGEQQHTIQKIVAPSPMVEHASNSNEQDDENNSGNGQQKDPLLLENPAVQQKIKEVQIAAQMASLCDNQPPDYAALKYLMTHTNKDILLQVIKDVLKEHPTVRQGLFGQQQAQAELDNDASPQRPGNNQRALSPLAAAAAAASQQQQQSKQQKSANSNANSNRLSPQIAKSKSKATPSAIAPLHFQGAAPHLYNMMMPMGSRVVPNGANGVSVPPIPPMINHMGLAPMMMSPPHPKQLSHHAAANYANAYAYSGAHASSGAWDHHHHHGNGSQQQQQQQNGTSPHHGNQPPVLPYPLVAHAHFNRMMQQQQQNASTRQQPQVAPTPPSPASNQNQQNQQNQQQQQANSNNAASSANQVKLAKKPAVVMVKDQGPLTLPSQTNAQLPPPHATPDYYKDLSSMVSNLPPILPISAAEKNADSQQQHMEAPEIVAAPSNNNNNNINNNSNNNSSNSNNRPSNGAQQQQHAVVMVGQKPAIVAAANHSEAAAASAAAAAASSLSPPSPPQARQKSRVSPPVHPAGSLLALNSSKGASAPASVLSIIQAAESLQMEEQNLNGANAAPAPQVIPSPSVKRQQQQSQGGPSEIEPLQPMLMQPQSDLIQGVYVMPCRGFNAYDVFPGKEGRIFTDPYKYKVKVVTTLVSLPTELSFRIIKDISSLEVVPGGVEVDSRVGLESRDALLFFVKFSANSWKLNCCFRLQITLNGKVLFTSNPFRTEARKKSNDIKIKKGPQRKRRDNFEYHQSASPKRQKRDDQEDYEEEIVE